MTVLASVCLFAAVAAPTNEVDVARQALRDGFLSVARAHARRDAGLEAKLIVLESYAHEENWSEIPKTLAQWGDPAGDAFAYYRALALAKSGDAVAAQKVFDTGLPADPVYSRLSARLLADLALADGNAAKAADCLARIAAPEPDDRMLLAEIRSRMGAQEEAQKIWREIVGDTNAAPRLVMTAAFNVGDAGALRAIVSNTPPSELRTVASLRLGQVLLRRDGTFAEGAQLIRTAVSESPDAAGACEAAQSLAAGFLDRGDWKEASSAFARLLEIWPEMAKESSVQERYGQVLLNLGRAEEALAALSRAEACAKTDEARATAAVRSGDALAALGRLDESMAKYRDVLERFPKTATAAALTDVVRLREQEKRGRALYRDFRFAEAEACFDEVASKDPLRRGRMAYFKVLCLYGQGRDAEAEALAQKLMASPADERLQADVTLWLARSAYNSARWTDADRLFGTFAGLSVVKPAEAAEARVWSARAALALNDFSGAITRAAVIVAGEAEPVVRAEALIVQGEALIELGRFEEAILVFERAAAVREVPAGLRLEARMSRADALFALGADNPARYEEALHVYRALAQTENVSAEDALSLAYKIGMTFEKLKRRDEAVDQYYAGVVLAYREARQKGLRFGDHARAIFARAAFRLADICESRGNFDQAVRTLELVAASDVPAAVEATRRIERIRMKGILP